jgi:hypothetical protein
LLEHFDVFIELRDLDVLVILLNGEFLSLLLPLDPFLRQLGFEISNHLLLVGLSILCEFVNEVTHPLDLRLSIVKQLFILLFDRIDIEHELPLLLF